MDGKKPSVMIIDDEDVICDVLCDDLSDLGYLCIRVFNGNDALAKLAARDFDVALVDIRLPGMSGVEVLRRMRSDYPNTAAIMITGANEVDVAVETMKLGASDYIVKPFDLGRVITSIRAVLEDGKGLSGKSDYEIPPVAGAEGEDKPVAAESSGEMNAIARGVEAKLDLLLGYSNVVTESTIDIARHLGVAEKEIQRWADARARLNFERDSAIESSINKLMRSPLAQGILGVTELYRGTSDLGESQN